MCTEIGGLVTVEQMTCQGRCSPEAIGNLTVASCAMDPGQVAVYKADKTPGLFVRVVEVN